MFLRFMCSGKDRLDVTELCFWKFGRLSSFQGSTLIRKMIDWTETSPDIFTSSVPSVEYHIKIIMSLVLLFTGFYPFEVVRKCTILVFIFF